MCFEMLTSSVGKKYVMAVTGIFLFIFVTAHLLGNLQIFLGQDALNDYSKHLADLPLLLWPARALLLLVLIAHVSTAIALALENKKARPIAYAHQHTVQASYASRTMMVSGPLVSLFLLYHLLHFTFGVTHPQFFHLQDAKGRHDVYSMVLLSFRDWKVAASYVLAVAVLSFHLSHGLSSVFQSLGWNNAAWNGKLKRGAKVVALIIFLGYASIPIASLTGLLKPITGAL